MKKVRNKLISAVLVLLLAMSIMPFTALADENNLSEQPALAAETVEQEAEQLTDLTESVAIASDADAVTEEASSVEEASAEESLTEATVTDTDSEESTESEETTVTADEEESTSAQGSEEESTEEDTPVTITEEAYTIAKNGIYKLQEGLSSAITVAAGVKDITIIGNGVVYDSDWTKDTFGTISSTANSITIDASAAAGLHITLQDLYNSVKANNANLINIAGTGNRLTINGIVLMDYDVGYTSANDALIHVAVGASLTIDGDGDYYQYNCTQGAGIGGNTREMNGEITFAMTGRAFIKGTRQGAVIGAGAGASSTSDAPGAVSFNSGTYNIITNSRGAAIGGSAGSTGGSTGTSVYISGNATLSVNTDFSGAAIGGGGYAEGNDSSGGTLYITGGSLRPYVDKNAASNVSTGWNGKELTEGVNDAIVTAYRTNGVKDDEGNLEKVYMCTVDLSKIEADANGKYAVKVDNSETVFYNGPGHSYVFAFDGVDRSTSTENVYPVSTISNWIPSDDSNLYLWLTGEEHTLSINGKTQKYEFNSETEAFEIVPDGTKVVFQLSPADADLTVSYGMGYTYVEETLKVYAQEEVPASEDSEAIPATKYVYVEDDGNYTATIVKDGYYASEFSFTVKGGVVSSDSANVRSAVLRDGQFVVQLPVFTPSTNAGAWDGKTIDVSWYSEDKTTMEISTPAQLMGLAAIVNGIYNAEITTIIDNIEGETKNYSPVDYAKLSGRKIRAAASTGDTGGAHGNNQVSSSTYWYGIKSDGTNSDFAGQTVLITADLDMGGYLANASASDYKQRWSGARYMTIGGQSPMHFIDFSTWYSDAYSIIGSSFNGTLDGQGHLIKNIYCERYVTGSNYGDSQSAGIIGRLGNHDNDPAEWAVKNPTIKNIAASGYISARRSVGGIVGKTGQSLATKGGNSNTDGPIIENCINFSEVYGTDAKGQGGIVGAGWNKAILRNVANFGYVYTGYNKTGGGIVGSNEAKVYNAYNVGYVNGVVNAAQAIGTNNGGAILTNVYWLTGSSYGDTNSYTGDNRIKYSAYWSYNANVDDLHEITTYAELKSDEFLSAINGTSRDWTKATASDSIYSLLQDVTFRNNVLDVTDVSATDMPVPRVFTTDTATVQKIEMTSEPEKKAYVAGQTLDTTGLEIWATWTDGTKELVPDYTVSVTEPLTVDDTEIVFSGTRGGQEYSFTFNITVDPREVDHIVVYTKPSNLVYAQNEEFDPAGMVVRGYFTDFPSTYVVLSEISDEVTDGYTWTLNGTTVTVSYTYGDKTVTDSFEITKLSINTPQTNEDGYYEIGSQDELMWFANQINAFQNYEINGLVVKDFKADSSFTGIGGKSTAYAYKGIFDGNGHTIDVDLTQVTNSYQGFFRVANGATIKNLTLTGSAKSTATTSGISAFVGNVTGVGNKVTIENCVNKVNITGGGQVGAFAGRVYNSAVDIINCVNEGSITATGTAVGGIVGYVYFDARSVAASIDGCVNKGSISSTAAQAGGIAGYIYSNSATINITIRNSVNDGSVKATSNLGGILGYSYNRYDKIEGCANHGELTGTSLTSNTGIGGIVGYMRGAITDSYNTGKLVVGTANANAGIGGLVGLGYVGASGLTLMENCYTSGEIESSTDSGNYGALLGRLYINPASAVNTYYLTSDLPTFGGTSTAGKILTGGEMKTQAELSDLYATLGEAYKESCPSPVLTWEDAVDHSYLSPVWNWTKDENGAYKASAELSCRKCGHKTHEEAVVTATEETGKTVYTASIEKNGTTYTDQKTVLSDEVKVPVVTVEKVDGQIVLDLTAASDIEFGGLQIILDFDENAFSFDPEAITSPLEVTADESVKEILVDTGEKKIVKEGDSILKVVFNAKSVESDVEYTISAQIKEAYNDGFEDYSWIGETLSATYLEKGGYHIIVDDIENNAEASIEATELYSGEVEFTVSCDKVCVVAIANEDGTYERLECTTTEDGEHKFTVTVEDADVRLVVVVLGDADLNGTLQGKDATLVKKFAIEDKTLSELQMLAADVNKDGVVNGKDGTLLSKMAIGDKDPQW